MRGLFSVQQAGFNIFNSELRVSVNYFFSMAISASTKKLIILFALLSAVVLVLLIVQSEQVIAPSLGKVEGYRKFEYQRGSVFVAGHRIEVEIAQTDEQRTQGLLGHKPLSSTAGMLFVFD